VDEVNIDDFVKEASIALEDEEQLREFIKEKATIAIERFLVCAMQYSVVNNAAWTVSLIFFLPSFFSYFLHRITSQKCPFQWKKEICQTVGRSLAEAPTGGISLSKI
jgi:hypothetical protein